ncbi:DMT family transporter [Devosia sp. MC532]|uniref:DMT family transporter n=1 Tax=Devosia sp. MC532 TaxID=2799788 RepID=UPI0018F34F78|nr:DMT family transporter [Devosia sp. MC532]MBJ7579447.1 DMT family transporter [Devosia sp. MC532]
MTLTKTTTLGIALAVITGALWGLVFLAPALAGAFPPSLLVAGRYIAYGLLAAPLLLFRFKHILPHLILRNLAIAFGLSIAGNTLYFLLLANAILMAGVPLSTLIIGFIPVTVALVGSFREGAVSLRQLWPALALGCGAIACITIDAMLKGETAVAYAPVTGLFLAIAALVSWTIFAVGNSFYLNSHTAMSAQDWNLILGVVTGLQGLMVLPIALQAGVLPSEAEVWINLLLVCAALALFASLIANALWNHVTRLLPLTLIGPMVLFETLFALLYGFLWEQRFPNTLEMAAIILMLVSVALSVLAHRPGKAHA